MPASSFIGKKTTKNWFLRRNDIKKIIDIGCGEGTYWNLLEKDTKDKNIYKWIGVDVWEPYIDRFQLFSKYDDVIIGDVREIALPDGDCYIFGDVLEHMTKEEAKKVIASIPKDKHLIISIPLGEYIQGAIEGNPYEEHKSYWNYEEVYALADWTETHTWCFNKDLPKLITLGLFIK